MSYILLSENGLEWIEEEEEEEQNKENDSK